MINKISLPASLISLAALAANNNKPNIIVFLTDDAGYADYGFMGSTDMITPNIDSIAANGVYFTDAHVTGSTCCPSRAGILTGRYQQRFGHEQNGPPSWAGLLTSETTLGEALKTVGYKTAAIGKWHMGETYEFHPNRRGFDYFYGHLNGSRSYWYFDGSGPSAIRENDDVVKFDGYLTDVFGDKTIEFIDSSKDDPFFIYCAFNAIHSPFQAKDSDKELFPNNNRGVMCAMNYAMDRAIGNIIQRLEDYNILDNTLIFFFSDNGGPNNGRNDNGPLKGYKGFDFEGGQRVAFAMQWNNVIQNPGREYTGLISSLDVFATSIKAAGMDKTPGKPLDGVDLIPYINGDSLGEPHDTLFWRENPWEAARIGDYKLIRASSAGKGVYNLDEDIGETIELSATNPDKLQSLENAMEEWNSEMLEQQWEENYNWREYKFYAYEDFLANRKLRITGTGGVSGLKEDLKYYQHYNDVIPNNNFKIKYFDSQHNSSYSPELTLDNDCGSFWHTGWNEDSPVNPHEIQIDLGYMYMLHGLRYSPKHDGWLDGMVTNYEIYLSTDGEEWGQPVDTGIWPVSCADKEAHFDTTEARYVRLVSKASFDNKSMAIAEINVMGSLKDLPCDDCINLVEANISSYSNSDDENAGTYEILETGKTLKVTGSRYLKLDSAFNITPYTTVEFEFMSSKQGKIHGIGFEKDNTPSSNRIFQVYGQNLWGTIDQVLYNNLDEYVKYNYRIGEYYTGEDMNLVFVSDDDDGDGTITSNFRNIRIYDLASLYTPAAPTALKASTVKSDRIVIRWEDNADNELGYYIERSDEGAEYKQIAEADIDSYYYTDDDVSPSTSYKYRIRAFNNAGISEYSNEIDATTLEATSIDNSYIGEKIKVYPNPATNVDGFQVVLPEEMNGAIQIINMTGKILHQQDFINSKNVLVNSNAQLIPGYYIINIKTEMFILKRKLLVNIK